MRDWDPHSDVGQKRALLPWGGQADVVTGNEVTHTLRLPARLGGGSMWESVPARPEEEEQHEECCRGEENGPLGKPGGLSGEPGSY